MCFKKTNDHVTLLIRNQAELHWKTHYLKTEENISNPKATMMHAADFGVTLGLMAKETDNCSQKITLQFSWHVFFAAGKMLSIMSTIKAIKKHTHADTRQSQRIRLMFQSESKGLNE